MLRGLTAASYYERNDQRMLYPSLASMLKQVNSRYLLVNIIAKRARDIAALANERDEQTDEKPVSRAIEELASGELRVTIPDEL